MLDKEPISQARLESYLWGAATYLRGTIDAGDYKQFIFPLLFYKRICDVYDEEFAQALEDTGGDADFAAFRENHRFQIPEGAHWNDVREVPTNIGQALQKAMRAVETANPDLLYGIFGDANWGNKERLPDATLRDLIEHYSSLTLSLENVPEDELGVAYEFLIKKFADDSGHTAAEFYTNRTVVHLMTVMLDPKEGEAIYDPTCGSGGMLLSSAIEVKRQGREWRNLKLYGQERNLLTSAIARMNLFLHGFEDFQIVRGDTLSEPKLLDGDRLRQFDLILANPPYSIKAWDRKKWEKDPFGRNLYGTPPQGRADYAFWQHILASLKPNTGRCAILFPHGVLFRQEEREMREKLVQADVIEAVIGLGPNLFYNSPMEACILVCRTRKSEARQNHIRFIDAKDEVTRERAQSFLTEEHIAHVVAAYSTDEEAEGFARTVGIDEIALNDFNLNLPLYIRKNGAVAVADVPLAQVIDDWASSGATVRAVVNELLMALKADGSDESGGNSETARLYPTDVDGHLFRTCKRAASKHGWSRVKFGDVAECVTDRVDDPALSGHDRYIGLEHLDADSLSVRRWGNPADYKSTKLLFKAGDVIFGKRNAYLRRQAAMDFAGICSAHSMVLRARDGVIDPHFLPILMSSDAFYERSLAISVGSLSPTINWRDLARQEFMMPPLADQRQIAEVVWAAEDVMQKYRRALESVQAVSQRLLADLMLNGTDWASRRVDELGEVLLGRQRAPQYTTGRYSKPYLRVANVFDDRLDLTDVLHMDFDDKHFTKYRLRDGDILLVEGNQSEMAVGRCAMFRGEIPDCCFQKTLIRFRAGRGILPLYALYLFRAAHAAGVFVRAAKKTTISHLTAERFAAIRFAVPDLCTQQRLMDRVSGGESVIRAVEAHIVATSKLKRELLVSLLGNDLCSTKPIP